MESAPPGPGQLPDHQHHVLEDQENTPLYQLHTLVDQQHALVDQGHSPVDQEHVLEDQESVSEGLESPISPLSLGEMDMQADMTIIDDLEGIGFFTDTGDPTTPETMTSDTTETLYDDPDGGFYDPPGDLLAWPDIDEEWWQIFDPDLSNIVGPPCIDDGVSLDTSHGLDYLATYSWRQLQDQCDRFSGAEVLDRSTQIVVIRDHIMRLYTEFDAAVEGPVSEHYYYHRRLMLHDALIRSVRSMETIWMEPPLPREEDPFPVMKPNIAPPADLGGELLVPGDSMRRIATCSCEAIENQRARLSPTDIAGRGRQIFSLLLSLNRYSAYLRLPEEYVVQVCRANLVVCKTVRLAELIWMAPPDRPLISYAEWTSAVLQQDAMMLF